MPQFSQLTAHNAPHIPVMLDEVLATLAPRKGGVYVDGTFGAGGYTSAILKAADCTVYAIDRDPDAIARAESMAQEFNGRLITLPGCFGDVETLLKNAGVETVDGFVLDLGVSSPQIDTPERGFSFRHEGPLDMRMGSGDGIRGQSAKDVVNTASVEELADIIFHYGEERAARKIARAIVAARPLETTKDLAKAVHKVLPMHGGLRTDTATKTFQALRIHVNDELGEIDRALESAVRILSLDGRLVVVSFHSLEDGRVKRFLREKSGKTEGASRHMPTHTTPPVAFFSVEKNSGLKASDAETARNPRSRSARLRYGIRTEAGAYA